MRKNQERVPVMSEQEERKMLRNHAGNGTVTAGFPGGNP